MFLKKFDQGNGLCDDIKLQVNYFKKCYLCPHIMGKNISRKIFIQEWNWFLLTKYFLSNFKENNFKYLFVLSSQSIRVKSIFSFKS